MEQIEEIYTSVDQGRLCCPVSSEYLIVKCICLLVANFHGTSIFQRLIGTYECFLDLLVRFINYKNCFIICVKGAHKIHEKLSRHSLHL